MFCSISGHVPEEPVVNSKTGQLYEKRLIEKTVQDTGQDPFTHEPLSLEDLVEVKSNKLVKPRPSPATSIPGLLNLLQQEWDALMLEMHQIRQALSTSRQELSFSLYMQDSASRVIARLLRERDAARTLAENAQRALEAAPTSQLLANGKRPADEDVEMADAGNKRAKAGITPDIREAMTSLSTSLSAARKKRVVSAAIAPLEAVQGYSLLSSHPLHKTTQGGILAIDTAPDNEQLVATAGSDHAVHLFDRSTERVTANLVGHSKKVTDVHFLKTSSSLVTTSADKTARLWVLNPETSTYQPTVLHEQSGEVTAVAPLASRDYFITTSLDKTWAFYDAESALCLQQVADPSVEAGFSSAAMHPDGIILGTGTQDSLVRLWETRTQKGIAKFEGHKGPVASLSFSENGYYLATAASDGVKVWDLRKLKNIRTLTPYETGQATAVSFDHSGLYLGVAGSDDARVYGTKQDWSLLNRFADLPAKGGLSVHWGNDAGALYVGASDHNLRIYGAQAVAADDAA